MGTDKNIKLHIVTDIKMLLKSLVKTISPVVGKGLCSGNALSAFSLGPKVIIRKLASDVNCPTLTLYSKAAGCSLCDDAKEVIFKHASKFIYEEVDITAAGNEVFFELYKHDIPVVHVNNVEVMRHRVLENALVEALDNAKLHMESQS